MKLSLKIQQMLILTALPLVVGFGGYYIANYLAGSIL